MIDSKLADPQGFEPRYADPESAVQTFLRSFRIFATRRRNQTIGCIHPASAMRNSSRSNQLASPFEVLTQPHVLIKFFHSFALVLLPVADENPFLLCGVPYPKAAEDAKFLVRNVVRRNQKQCPTSGATPLFSKGKVPSTPGTSITLCSCVHENLIQALCAALRHVHPRSSQEEPKPGSNFSQSRLRA